MRIETVSIIYFNPKGSLPGVAGRRHDGCTWRIAAMVAAFVAGLVVRYVLRAYATYDTPAFLMPWYDYARLHGARSLSVGFTNYAPLYSYFLIAVAQFDGLAAPLSLIKSISGAFELASAVLAYEIVRAAGGGANRAAVAFGAVWLAPTVLFNGAAWGQCDSMWSCFALLAIWLLLRGRHAAPAFGAAFAAKAQGVFLGPLMLGLVLRRTFPPTAPLWLPAMYGLCAIPVLIAGRPVMDVLAVYAKQADTFHFLSLNAANIWAPLAAFVPCSLGVPIGLCLAAVGGLALAWQIGRTRLEDPEAMLVAAAASLFLLPFLLPKMHDRYFYGFEVTAIVLATLNGRYVVIALAAQICGLISYLAMTDGAPATVQGAAVVNVMLLWLLLQKLREHESSLPSGKIADFLNLGRPTARPSSGAAEVS